MSYSVSPSMQLKFPEKIGYACGDMASNLYWRLFDLYLMLFYTDVFGIPAKAAGTIATVAIIFNAICDPAMGALADRTTTRFGKFRPYLLWGILPIISAGVLLVTVPDWNADDKLIWAYGTYILMMLCYSFINVPYGSLLAVITSDGRQRTTLTSFRFFGAFAGGSIVAYLLPTLVKLFGNANEQLGWQLTMLFFGILAGALFLTSFLTTRERIAPPVHQQSSPVQDLKDLMHNPPWIVLFFLALIIMITISMRATAGSYYVKYHLGRPDLLSYYNLTYMISLAIGALATPFISRFFQKKTLLWMLMAAVGVLSIGFFFIPKDQIILIFIVNAAIGLVLGPKSPLVYSMYADTADYTEWKLGRRATAMTFAAASFSQKIGAAIATAGLGFLMGALGYQANVIQTSASDMGIVMLLTVVPAIFAMIAALVIQLYRLDAAQIEVMQKELAERKTAFQPTT